MTNLDVPKGRTDAAVQFLNRWHAAFPRLITAIHPDTRRVLTATFQPGEEDRMAAFIEARQGIDNLYFTANVVLKPYNGGVKPKKDDISLAISLFVDIDPPPGVDLQEARASILARLRAHLIPPSVIVFSGGGYQAFWRLAEPVPLNGNAANIAVVEARSRKLAYELGGDHVQNVDRLMRLPGTLNVPDAKKIAKGRSIALAEVIHA